MVVVSWKTHCFLVFLSTIIWHAFVSSPLQTLRASTHSSKLASPSSLMVIAVLKSFSYDMGGSTTFTLKSMDCPKALPLGPKKLSETAKVLSFSKLMFSAIWRGIFNLKVCIPCTSKSMEMSLTMISLFPFLSVNPMKQPLFHGHFVWFWISTCTDITSPGCPSMPSGFLRATARFSDHLDLLWQYSGRSSSSIPCT